jgi:hypothetical protein
MKWQSFIVPIACFSSMFVAAYCLQGRGTILAIVCVTILAVSVPTHFVWARQFIPQQDRPSWKFSLRNLLVVTVIVPPLVGGIVSSLMPPPRGSPAAMRAFLRELNGSYSSSAMEFHTTNCFIVGSPAATYKTVLAKANKTGPSTYGNLYPTGIEYHFWCEGKDSAQEADHAVIVVVDGAPPVIVRAESTVYLK